MTWYTGDPTYDAVLAGSLLLAVIIAVSSLFVIAPYGRFASKKFGLSLDPRLGWLAMELPAPISFLVFFWMGSRATELVPLLFLGVWLIHYGNRAFYFPLSMRVAKGQKSSFSWIVVVSGWVVTVVHGYLNATFISELGAHYEAAWLQDPRFLAGITLYALSLGFNIHSDAILRGLRTKEEVASGQKVYRVPRGGLFRYVSCPSYLTELLAWVGFALATWSLGAVFVLLVSAANLIPRAFATHRWYLERFADYPKDRKALIPFIL